MNIIGAGQGSAHRAPKDIRILIACEESQTVCIEFRRLGFSAYSCDIQPCSGGHPEWHIIGDVLPLISQAFKPRWDLIIAHPPCTRLCNSGVRWLSERDLWKEMKEAAYFFMRFLSAACDNICIENPIMHKHARKMIVESGWLSEFTVKKDKQYTQIVHPYWFGEGETKATCLTLKGLPCLQATHRVDGRGNKIHFMSPGEDRSKKKKQDFQRNRSSNGRAMGSAHRVRKEPRAEHFGNLPYST
jgi:hypothetical protein